MYGRIQGKNSCAVGYQRSHPQGHIGTIREHAGIGMWGAHSAEGSRSTGLLKGKPSALTISVAKAKVGEPKMFHKVKGRSKEITTVVVPDKMPGFGEYKDAVGQASGSKKVTPARIGLFAGDFKEIELPEKDALIYTNKRPIERTARNSIFSREDRSLEEVIKTIVKNPNEEERVGHVAIDSVNLEEVLTKNLTDFLSQFGVGKKSTEHILHSILDAVKEM